MIEHLDLLIVGAGPTGLGAAERAAALNREGDQFTWAVVEHQEAVGGAATTVVDGNGFRWDLGGHIVHSHYREFDELLRDVTEPEGMLTHPRQSLVLTRGRRVPFPFQANTHRLAASEQLRSVATLVGSRVRRVIRRTTPDRDDLAAWFEREYGRFLAQRFFLPFNEKMWAVSPAAMGSRWTSQRSGSVRRNVPESSVSKSLVRMVTRRDELTSKRGETFQYPYGTTASIWQRLHERLPPASVRFGWKLIGLDITERVAHFDGGRSVQFGAMVTTAPLDQLCMWTGDSRLAELSSRLRHSGTALVGFGLRGDPPDWMRGVQWLYFPDSEDPMFRAFVLSNYSPQMSPTGSWSLMSEVSMAPGARRPAAEMVDAIRHSLERHRVLPVGGEVVSTFTRDLDYGYPTPTLDRDPVLREIHNRLGSAVLSRGRFGGWCYEVSNQDHGWAQGREAVDRLRREQPETTYRLGTA